MAALRYLPLLHPPVYVPPPPKPEPVQPEAAAPEAPMGPAPKTRGDCLPGGVNAARPCRWVSCRHHLTSEKGSCVLDIVSRGGDHTLEQIAEIMGGLTRERIRQIEQIALRKMQVRGIDLRKYLSD